MISKDTKEAKVTFIYEKKTIQILGSVEEELCKFFERFVTKLNANSSINDYEFYYEGHKLTNITNIQKSDIIKDKKEFAISAFKKTKKIKCPKCICNDCILKISNYHLSFYGCKYGHKEKRLIDDYYESQKINLCQIVCSKSGCNKNQSNDPKDFYKCLTCTKLLNRTKYYCNDCSKTHDQSHIKITYDEKNYYCEKHFNKLIKYCFTCKEDLCEECENDHKNQDHRIKAYESIIPNIKEIKESLDKIKTNIDLLRHIVDDMKENIDNAMKIYEKYKEIADDIIEKYELYNKKNKNYCILKTMRNLKNSNSKIIEDLNVIISGSDLKDKINNLINIYLRDRDKYKDIINNTVENETNEDGLDNDIDNFNDNIQEEEKNDEKIKEKKKNVFIKHSGTRKCIKNNKK